MTDTAPLLVLAVGNPSRGDDAVGPLLAERLTAAQPTGVDVLTDFQFNIEHVLDFAGRRRVLLIDASQGGRAPYQCERLQPANATAAYTSHLVAPRELLGIYRRTVDGVPPPVDLLTIPGEQWDLGSPLSDAATERLEAAWDFVQRWCAFAHVEGQADHA